MKESRGLMNNVYGCIWIRDQPCKSYLATDPTVNHRVGIKSPPGCDWSNQSSQQPAQRQQPHLLQLFHPYFHFPHLPPPSDIRICYATACILMSLCEQRNVSIISAQKPRLKHHTQSYSTQLWKAVGNHWWFACGAQVRFRFRLGLYSTE